MKEGIGSQFQKETKYYRADSLRRPRALSKRPDESLSSLLKVRLDPPHTEGGMPLWETVKKRRSVRNFREAPLSKEVLSQLLWAAQGITKRIGGYEFRSAPSAGACYPLETYLGVFNVGSLEPGIFRYDLHSHELVQLSKGDFRDEFADASLGQDFIASANVLFIWTAIFERSRQRYRERAYRYIYLDAGHIAQNLALAAVALGLGSCQIGALYDDEINALVGADGLEESVVYMTAVGHPR